MTKLPLSLIKVRDELAEQNASTYQRISKQHSFKQPWRDYHQGYMEGFDAGANAVLESAELEVLVEALRYSAEMRALGNYLHTHRHAEALKRWQKFVGGE